MKDKVFELADGHGEVKRSIKKMEFGSLLLEPMATIGKHAHKDAEDFKHSEIYITFSKDIRVNGKWRFIAVCRNAEHYACNISRKKWRKIFFLKLWW